MALSLPVQTKSLLAPDRPAEVAAKQIALLTLPPWVRTVGKLAMEVTTQGWRFPTPSQLIAPAPSGPPRTSTVLRERTAEREDAPTRTRVKPPADAAVLKDRLLYLLQPPLESILAGRQVHLPCKPYPYQLQGIAFLMPRHAALLADEMGLGKTAQVLIALRLLFYAGLVRRALVVCPKPLVLNWAHELRMWAEDLPFEVIGGDTHVRRTQWRVSNCPLKLVNYELLTRDAEDATGEDVHFDVVVLDEAQRIKNATSKTAQVVRGLRRERSWAMTGTPIENRTEDLINIFSFVDPGRIPPETQAKAVSRFTGDSILRRTKEEVAPDMPPRIVRDTFPELTPAQREAYELAESDGVVHLNELGDTISVQHVFELIMRLKQICNFDPRTGQSAKLEQLVADLAEVADSNRKAIVFSQWVEPLEQIARAVKPCQPLLFHGRVSQRERQPILDRFKNDAGCHVLLMTYGTGSVGLNLQFANYVFLFDRWWNPAVEDQAINRAHRIGQKEPVFVTRFITPNTIEERIAEILEHKRQIFCDMLEQNGPPPSLGLNEQEIFSLFNIRARPKRAAA